MKTVNQLKTKIFADGADKAGMLQMYQHSYIKGFTTNPTIMRKAGIQDYEEFARDILDEIPNRPISFEVFSDDLDEMYDQALTIGGWGDYVYVKIPVTNSKGHTTYDLIKTLAKAKIKMNVTAVFTLPQVSAITDVLQNAPSSYISVFAGRIADTGRDPLPVMQQALQIMAACPHLELIWASPRELLNIFHADQIGCHIITVTNDILNKLSLVGKDLTDFSLETVNMFYKDAQAAGYQINTRHLKSTGTA